MILKAPLKISAVGLSLLAIAVSSCNKGATNTSDNNTPAPLDPKNDPASNKNKKLVIKIAQPKIPSGTCTSYEVSATDEADQTVNITGNKFLSVHLNETSQIKQFSLDAAKHLICARNNATSTAETILALEGSKATLVASTQTNTATDEVEAVAKINFVAVEVAYPASSSKLNVAVGTKTAQFQIKTKQFFSSTAEAIQSAEGFELVDNANNKVELKSETAGQFYFEIPKTAKVGKIQYTLRSTTQPNINTPIDIQVAAAVLTSVALKDTLGNTIPSVLTTDTNLALTLEGIFSDDSKVSLSDATNSYTVASTSPGITVDSAKSLILFKVPAAGADTFSPKVLTFTVEKNGNAIKDLNGKDFTVQYYVNNKPQLDALSLKFNNTNSENIDTVAIGGSLETTEVQRNLRCAKLTEAKFKVGDSELATVNLDNLIITVPENSNFKAEGKYICATDKATLNSTVIATIASKDDPSVKAEKVFTAGNNYVTKKIAMVNDLNDQVAKYTISLSETHQKHTLKFKYLNSDNSLSNEPVPASNIVANLVPADYFIFNSNTLEVSIKDANALNALKEGATNSQKIIISSNVDNKFTTEIPVTFSK